MVSPASGPSIDGRAECGCELPGGEVGSDADAVVHACGHDGQLSGVVGARDGLVQRVDGLAAFTLMGEKSCERPECAHRVWVVATVDGAAVSEAFLERLDRVVALVRSARPGEVEERPHEQARVGVRAGTLKELLG